MKNLNEMFAKRKNEQSIDKYQERLTFKSKPMSYDFKCAALKKRNLKCRKFEKEIEKRHLYKRYRFNIVQINVFHVLQNPTIV